jgi:hypothetical protein
MTSQAGVRGRAAFAVRSHPKLRDLWPGEPGGAYDHGYRAPLDANDILREVLFYAPVAGANSDVALVTDYQGQRHTRDIILEDATFARKFAAWLRKNTGRSIQEIGDLPLELD